MKIGFPSLSWKEKNLEDILLGLVMVALGPSHNVGKYLCVVLQYWVL